MKHFKLLTLSLGVAAGIGFAMPVLAAEEASQPPHRHWHSEGVFGLYDKAQLQRGLQVYRQVCAACHGLKRVAYRNLEDLGYNEDEIKAIAAEASVTDGPNDEGEMFTRAGRPSDRMVGPFANDQQARYANNGALPPDLSLIVKARHHGANYVAGLLTGYTNPPEDVTLPEGMYWNKYMAGHQIAMAPPLSEGIVSYADETPATVEQMAEDVSAFLTWASEPTANQRKMMGLHTLLFLIFFAALMYGVKKRVWKDVKK